MKRARMLADFRELRRLCLAVAEQCGHYERNVAAGREDEIRGWVAGQDAIRMATIGKRMARRFERARGITVDPRP